MLNDYNFFIIGADSREVLERDDKNRKVVNVTIETVEESESQQFFPYDRKSKKMLKFFVEALQKYPETFYIYDRSLSKDLTPATEPLPDGEYIQYYRDAPYLDNKTIRYKNDVVAAVFTIRNNKVEGYAKWIAADGKLIKEGNYAAGARNGNWKVYSYSPKQTETYEETQLKNRSVDQVFSNIFYDTLIESTDYSMGLANGRYLKVDKGNVLESGYYKNDQPSGQWEIWQYAYFVDEKVNIDSEELILVSRFTYADPDQRLIGKSIIIREEMIPFRYLYQRDTTYNLGGYGSDNFFDFTDFYEIAFPDETEEVTELSEEVSSSYEGEEMPDYSDYYDSEYESVSRNDLIDSLGYIFSYTGIYEKYYINGQLKMRFEIKNGTLVEEDTIFWNNGQAANVVNYLPDSNMYEQLFYDFDGLLIDRFVYDSKGNRIERESEENYGYLSESTVFDGKTYSYADNHDTFVYRNRSALNQHGLTEKVTLEKQLWKKDSTVCKEITFDPVTRTYEHTIGAISKKPGYHEQAVFGEDYTTVNAFQDAYVGDLRLHSQYNGSKNGFPAYYGFFEGRDTFPDYFLADEWSYYYELENDHTLFLKEQPFSGSFDIQLQQKKYSMKTAADAVSINIPRNEFKQVWSARYNYWKRGKQKPILDVIQPGAYGDYSEAAVLKLVPFAEPFFNRWYNYDYTDTYGSADLLSYERLESREIARREKKKPVNKIVTGRYLNGKPEGLWAIKDQFGDAVAEISFLNGEQDGDFVQYTTLPGLSKEELKYARDNDVDLSVLELVQPLKDTRFVSTRTHFKNGRMDGPSVTMSWKGDTTNYAFYKDGYQVGKAFQRNTLVYSAYNFEDGSLDGISRTWLTLPGRDSILLFDLNFQNGMLQGESKAYHTNGRLAKRGFFLTGEPIDDYEAYDTLGFRYQYVKFLYSQPVEEKIWEENQLSVRYEFDWKDSIPFDISDISGSTSVEGLLADLGFGGNGYRKAYYGRPSLVDKTGITYTMTKYYPNDQTARHGKIVKGKKTGRWEYFSYEGKPLYTVDYADTILVINDSIKFRAKGILTYPDAKGAPSSRSYIIEKIEKYDCSHTDHYEERMLYTTWEKDSSVHRINGYVKNYYDNGALQNEGQMVNGLPSGIWKMYDSYGNLSRVGEYVMGKRHGRWLSGDLGEVKYMGDICLNPNLPNLEEIMSYQEKMFDVTVSYYQMGSVLKTEYYGINMNSEEDPSEGYYGDEEYEGGY